MLVMPVLIAIDLQATGPEPPVVTIGHPKDARALTISVEHEFPSAPEMPKLLSSFTNRIGAAIQMDHSLEQRRIAFNWA